MLDVTDVDNLVFQRGHLVPRETALRGREVERINAVIDHTIALFAVFKKVATSERSTSSWRTLHLRRDTANELCLLAMPGPWGKGFLILLQLRAHNLREGIKALVQDQIDGGLQRMLVVAEVLGVYQSGGDEFIPSKKVSQEYWDLRGTE